MKIRELLPSAEDWKRLQDIESGLLRRKTVGALAGVIAALSFAFQVILVLAEKGENLRDIFSTGLDPPMAIAGGILLAGSVVWFVFRRTSLLLVEAKEAFRYTFWIESFTEVDETLNKRLTPDSSDRFALLQYDLIERLNQRIHRFSIHHEPLSQEKVEAEASRSARRRYSSHIHISGHYAIREEAGDGWVIHVMPVVRIGPPESPATLAQPVKYRLNGTHGLGEASAAPSRPGGKHAPEQTPEGESEQCATDRFELNAAEYRDLVERVYSSVSTQIYEQINTDIRAKIGLFPTAHLRALALYREAEDFARSNTIDAYDRALALYREALRYFDLTWKQTPMKGLLWARCLLWRGAVRYYHEWARVVAGYAKCLIYRQQMSELMGREANPLYELPERLAEVIVPLEELQKRIGRRSAASQLERMLAYLMYPRDSWSRRVFGRSYTPLFDTQRNVLFELYLVDALANNFLDCREKSLDRLKDAAATAPDRIAKDPLYLLALGLVEPVFDKAILYFRQAVELAPDFQMARWYLAWTHDRAFRRHDELKVERAHGVLDDYYEVLRLNYGNIRALSARGFLRWLIGDSAGARQSLEQGKGVKAIASETFIGELNYRLARIEAECKNLERCRTAYEAATAADPEVGAFQPSTIVSRLSGADFVEISPSMLLRYEAYKKRALGEIEKERTQGTDPLGDRPPLAEETLRVVHAFVLNDYANACLRYFHYHGDNYWLQRAIQSYKEATVVNPYDARPWFNLQNAYSWNNDFEKITECYQCARNRAPTWTSVAIAAAKDLPIQLSRGLDERRRRLSEIDRKLEQVCPVPSERSSGQTEESGPASARSQKSNRAAEAANWAFSDQRPDKPKPDGAKSKPGAAPFAASAYQLPDKPADKDERTEIKGQVDQLQEEFNAARDEALKVIQRNSRLAALFAGTIQEHVERLILIPRRKLDGRDVEAMTDLAELLALPGNPADHLVAAQTLGAQLLDLTPEDYRVAGLLLGLKRLQELAGGKQTAASIPGTHAHPELWQRVERQERKIVVKWIETECRNFLALYWYFDHWQRSSTRDPRLDAELLPPNALKDKYFADVPHVYEDLYGWVLFKRGEYREAAAAFSRAVNAEPTKALYHFHLGQCRQQLKELESARAAYCKALHLEPANAEYGKGLASALNQIAERHWEGGRFADAADNYGEAVRLAPEVALYRHNLAHASELAKLPDARSAVESASREMQTALKLDPRNRDYQNESRRLQVRSAALERYGSSKIMSFVTSVAALAVEYGKDLKPFVRAGGDEEIGDDLAERYDALQNRIERDYGIRVPRARWRLNETNMPRGSYLVMVNEVPLAMDSVHASKKLCPVLAGELPALGNDGYSARDPRWGGDAVWLEEKDWPKAEANRWPLYDALDYVLRHLEAILVSRLHHVLGHEDLFAILRKSELPNVAAIAKSADQTNALLEMLRALLAERTPITSFDDLASRFLKRRDDAQPGDVIEDMRSLEAVRAKLWGNSNAFTLVPVGSGFERLIAEGIANTGTWRVLAMKPDVCQKALNAVRNALAEVTKPALVVTKPSLRIHVRNLIEIEFPEVPVLAERELLKELSVDATRTIEIDYIKSAP